MGAPKKKFEEFQKDCTYKTYQDVKCVHSKNKQKLLVRSCTEKLCPLKGKEQKEKEQKDKATEKKQALKGKVTVELRG